MLSYSRSGWGLKYSSPVQLLLTILVLKAFLLSTIPMPAEAALAEAPINWSNFGFVPFTYNGAVIYDYESSSDPSRGTGGVSPPHIDISSCSPDGYLPGTQPSFMWSYYDAGTPTVTADDHLALRIRLNGTPLEQSKVGLASGHWFTLIDIDNDGYKEFAIDVDGTVGSNQPDRVYLLYNDLPTNSVTARSGAQRSQSDTLSGDEINLWYAAGPAATGIAQVNNHVRVTTATPACYGGNEFWLDVQLPISAFKVGGVQKLDPATPARFFVSTSASAADPMQKDWVLKVLSSPIFSDTWQPTVYASKMAVLFTDTDGNGAVSPGDVLRYDISIHNIGHMPMLDVLFNDKISDSNLQLNDNVLTTAGAIIKGNTSGDSEVTVNVGTIAAGASENISFHVTILDTFAPGVSVVSNQGLVSGSNFNSTYTDDPSTLTPSDATRTAVTIPPNLHITKEGPDTASAGSYITFTGTLINYGSEPAENVTLVDILPAGLTFFSSSHSAIYDAGANTITWHLGTLSGGASIPGWVTVLADNTTPNDTVLTNTFSATCNDSRGKSYGPSTATKNVTILNIPFLQISKSGPAHGSPGALLTYTGTLTNPSNSTAENAILVDYLPAGLTFVSSSHGAVYDPVGKTVTWYLGSLQAGGSIPGWVTVQVDSGIPNGTSLTDSFSVTWQDNIGTRCGPETSSATTTIYSDPQVTITKEGPHEAVAGSYITFTGTLTNVGGSPAEGVILVDYLPPGLTFVSSSHNAIYDPAASTITWYLGNVGAGGAIPGWVAVHVDDFLPDGTYLINTFSTTWNDTDGGSHGPATATAGVIIHTHPVLEISKTGPAEGRPGSMLTFTITLANSGGLDAQNVVLVDSLPDKYTFNSSSNPCTVSGGNLVWQLGMIAAGSTAQIKVIVTVNNDVEDGTSLVNSAITTWQYDQDSYGPVGSSVATTIYTLPNLVIDKSGPTSVNPGDICTYSIIVTNVSSASATNTVLVDYIPGLMSYVGSSPAGTAAGDNVTWNLGSIAPGGSRSVSVFLKADPSITQVSKLIDSAMATWYDAEGNSYGPAGAIVSTTVNPFPVLSPAINGPATGGPCDTLTFKLKASNPSSTMPAYNSVLQYILPSGTEYVSSSDAGAYADGAVSWNLGTLAAGSIREVNVTINYCVIPIGSEIVSTVGLVWQYPEGTLHGPVFDSTRTLIVTPPAPPTPTPPAEPAATALSSPSPMIYTSPVPQSSAPGSVIGPWAEKPQGLPNIVVQSASLSTSKTEPGMPVEVHASVINKGTVNGSSRINLYVSGQIESTVGIVLASGEQREIVFTLYRNEPGSYSVYVNSESAGIFNVDNTFGSTLLLIFSWGCVLSAFILAIILVRRRLKGEY